MISNKTAAILLLITLNVELITSTSSDTQGPSSSGKLVPRLKMLDRVSGTKSVLADTTSIVEAVGATRKSIEAMNISQEQPTSQLSKRLEELVGQEEYEKAVELGKGMNREEFVKQLSSVVKTPEQSKGLAEHLGKHDWTVPFYVYGDFGVVKKAIIAYSSEKDFMSSAKGGILVSVLKLALKKDKHDRAVELLNFREETASGKTVWPHKSESFEEFLSFFFEELTTETDGMTLKRFLTLHEDKFQNKCPDIFDTFYRKLVAHLTQRLSNPTVEKLLLDLVGQPSMLTPTLFARGYLGVVRDVDRWEFVEHAWYEAIVEGLKKECPGGGEKLWKAMTKYNKQRFSEDYPSTPDALAAVLKWFPKKQQKEDEWIKKNASAFLDTIKLIFADIFPTELTSLVIGYARPTWIDVLCINSE